MFSKLQIIEETITISLVDKDEVSLAILNERVKKAGEFFMCDISPEDQQKLIKNLEDRFRFKMPEIN